MKRAAFSLFFALLAVSGCSQKLANYDYDTGAYFHQLKSYGVKASDKQGYQTLDSARIEEAIKSALSGRYALVDAQSADFVVTYIMEEDRQIDQSGVSIGFGLSRGNVGVGVNSGPKVKERVEGRLVLSIVSAESQQVIWQAKATQTLRNEMKPDRREQLIQSTVSEMLTNFPP